MYEKDQVDKLSVLILDDEVDFTSEMNDYLTKAGFITFSANNIQAGSDILSNHKIDLLILDVRFPGENGLDFLQSVKSCYQDIEVIMVSAFGDMDTVVQSLRLGAFDYLRKPIRYIDIQIAIERTRKYLNMQRKMELMKEKCSLITSDLELKIGRHCIGKSPQIIKIYELAKKASQYADINVLITGESGTGKEIFARIIHYMSAQSQNYFGAINCGAISESLMESEFFGHKKGSFTGAISDRKGLFEVCHEGTLFLDEISDMPMNLQSKMLRAIEERTITKVGDTKPIKTSFRLISATNCDLQIKVNENKFRLDLLHRLNTLHIHIPPLRERPKDIGPLLIDFTAEFSKRINKPIIKISEKVFDILEKYSFPGNIRELRNLVERAIILSNGKTLEVKDFLLPQVSVRNSDHSPLTSLAKNEAELIRKTFNECSYNQMNTAKYLDISRYSLIRKLKKYGIDGIDINSHEKMIKGSALQYV